jgi:energy-converting hydrogenase Eha subunit A
MQPVAAGLVDWLGAPLGLICHETLITTPLIFLGLQIIRRIMHQRIAQAQRVLFLVVGLMSAIAALYNSQFLF